MGKDDIAGAAAAAAAAAAASDPNMDAVQRRLMFEDEWGLIQHVTKRSKLINRHISSRSGTPVINESPREPDSWWYGNGSAKNVVVVMDALKDFSTKPLEWALEHVVEPGYMLTLLGVMPWLSLPLLCKTWLDIWTLDIGGLSNCKERSEWKKDPKHQRLLTIVDLCEARGVVPLIKVVMGYPVHLMVLEQTINLHASWVVFDKYQRKKKSFYMNRIPCNMVMMKSNGQFDVLRVRPVADVAESSEIRTSNSTSTISPMLTPQEQEMLTSTEWIQFLSRHNMEEETQENNDRASDNHELVTAPLSA